MEWKEKSSQVTEQDYHDFLSSPFHQQQHAGEEQLLADQRQAGVDEPSDTPSQQEREKNQQMAEEHSEPMKKEVTTKEEKEALGQPQHQQADEKQKGAEKTHDMEESVVMKKGRVSMDEGQSAAGKMQLVVILYLIYMCVQKKRPIPLVAVIQVYSGAPNM